MHCECISCGVIVLASMAIGLLLLTGLTWIILVSQDKWHGKARTVHACMCVYHQLQLQLDVFKAGKVNRFCPIRKFLHFCNKMLASVIYKVVHFCVHCVAF